VQSARITGKIDDGDLSEKPGWVRVSIHPTTTDEELEYILDAIEKIAMNRGEWVKEYRYSQVKNEYEHDAGESWGEEDLASWFDLGT